MKSIHSNLQFSMCNLLFATLMDVYTHFAYYCTLIAILGFIPNSNENACADSEECVHFANKFDGLLSANRKLLRS